MGTYIASVKYLWEIIEDIADQLIATGDWTDADATWTTAVKTAENARRALVHTADGVYLSLIMENGAQSNGGIYWKGLVIIFSSGWNAGAHTPDGTKYYTFVPFEVSTVTINADLTLFNLDYRLFTSVAGFALVVTPQPNATDNQQGSCIAVVERNVSKLYADAFTNFYIFVDGNFIRGELNTSSTVSALFGVNYKWWKYSRPFTLQSQTGWEGTYAALASRADGKAYFARPILHNDASNLSPIFQADMFITADNTRAINDDDEIALPGPSTEKYQITIKQSPDSAAYMQYGIKKAE